ncbi:hypothetical protein H5410_022011 [Solanum commersonii]|uniref:MADS-box domain-containing protein n=1 Tax=Solanum commersonii TaxID=4109 RepID=A0A9J5ZDK4_SOLCO|nr:hypothetical protein H5410_022011 [Solanum commersonii]
MTARINKGRQRVDVVKMKNARNLQVTFSKRRAGLLKKASELCTLCGAEIVIVVFSLGDKGVFSFGHPSIWLATEPERRRLVRDGPKPKRNRSPQPGTVPEPGQTGIGNSGKNNAYPSRTGNGPGPDQTGNRVPTDII